MAYHISRAAEREWVDVKDVPGLRQALMVGEVHGSHHMEVSLYELAPGASLGWNRCPFEESWFITAGNGRAALAGLEYDLGSGDYGVAPVGLAHSLSAGDQGLSWFSVRAPKPPAFDGARSSISAQPLSGEYLGRPSETDPRHRFVGHYSESDDVVPFGDLSMPGYHGPNIKNIGIRMMVDQLLGAQHHTTFIAGIAARSGPGRAAKVHYHPFEEIYYFIGGGMRGWIDGNEEVTETGDLVWVSTDGTHGFVNEREEPARWIEVQSPVPPTSDAFFFPDDWRALPQEDGTR
ncbi:MULTISPECIES: cupin domain-containing protein [Streptomyces]|jgi:quercetin dioxygenase-like cupin family protein|uniref:Cupin domain-containing protein n=1 Tax=Streptomyces spinosisporus TaxID=2927582 RepID=A0ABS9XHQ0_9ACTN|nr:MULTISPECIES: cupin domain-containing protein [Streptomyces]MCI3241565.1 cupin domain-containing protein [Streptomyces spinosisporus]WUB33590.1 cupin domain-containing protein [Streptomyces sp. NBC_00588]